jgi:hypothetical protein
VKKRLIIDAEEIKYSGYLKKEARVDNPPISYAVQFISLKSMLKKGD